MREADLSVEVKNEWSYNSTPYAFIAWTLTTIIVFFNFMIASYLTFRNLASYIWDGRKIIL